MQRHTHIPKSPRDQRRELSREDCDREPPPELLHGIEQFNAGEYWDCHETLEGIWRAETGDIRYLYQGILLVGVGLHHLHGRNHHGAVVKLRSGIEMLESFAPKCMGVDVESLRRDALSYLELLSEGRERIDDALRLPAVRCKLFGRNEETGE